MMILVGDYMTAATPWVDKLAATRDFEAAVNILKVLLGIDLEFGLSYEAAVNAMAERAALWTQHV